MNLCRSSSVKVLVKLACCPGSKSSIRATTGERVTAAVTAPLPCGHDPRPARSRHLLDVACRLRDRREGVDLSIPPGGVRGGSGEGIGGGGPTKDLPDRRSVQRRVDLEHQGDDAGHRRGRGADGALYAVEPVSIADQVPAEG